MMTIALIEKKVRAEIEDSKRGLGDIALYSLVKEEARDENIIKDTLRSFGYTLTEIANMKARYNYSKNRRVRV